MIAEGLKEDIRRDALGRLKAVDVLGIRSDALLASLKKDSRYAQLTMADLQAEMLKMAAHGWLEAKTNPLAPAVSNYKLTPFGHEFCYELGIG